nr:MAG TPA: hypothetical protein [Caudoviricetes sp.]DAX71564.1 MAG TPA: hypothetical protein [Caudoviricetes sp.]
MQRYELNSIKANKNMIFNSNNQNDNKRNKQSP